MNAEQELARVQDILNKVYAERDVYRELAESRFVSLEHYRSVAYKAESKNERLEKEIYTLIRRVQKREEQLKCNGILPWNPEE